ncbi:unnamed protein product [Adineta ricciae]|uniref:Uncharacterized protein n=1 Tax=Adineta ricciae TaxID=249248 RepID=A0A814C5C6_ADIRI|nr:unnamed protein product [Adineta ricciae]CAF0937895.1 unnamed protein product [Adineta ricciae]
MGAGNGKGSSNISFNQAKSVAKPLIGHNKNLPVSSSRQSDRVNSIKTGSSLRFVEDIILIWLDSSLAKPDDSTKNALEQLVRVTDIFKKFADVEQCCQFISSVQDEKIFLIVSGSLGPKIAPQIENLNQVSSIFIYCGNKANHEQWTKQYKKIRSLHTQVRELCETVKFQIRQYDKSITSISILPVSATMQMNPSNKEFIIFQVLKSMLIENQYDKSFRREFMNYSRQFYSENSYQLNIIDTFEDNYSLHSPIWWYTRRCCIYFMLRRAFATQDAEILYKLAFFIRDLHRDIKKSYLQMHSHQHRAMSVYRSTRITNDMLTNIEKNANGLLAFNDFLLTTLERSMALKFANSLRSDSNYVAVIFKIDIDPVSSSVPYISLNNLSYLSNTEGEILFSMNTIFRINQILKLNERLYEMTLIPVMKKDEQIRQVVDYIQQATANASGWYKLGKILLEAYEYDQLKSLYEYLLSQTDDSRREERAYLQHELGYIQDLRNDLPSAISYYKQALETCQKFLPVNHVGFATTYANLAAALQRQGDFSAAMNYYQQAIKCCNNDDINYVLQSINIATVLQSQGKYSEAEKKYEQSINTLLRDFPIEQLIVADAYHHLASLAYSMKDYKKALSNYENVVVLEEKILPTNHPTLISIYFNIATTHEALGNYEKAIFYAEKATNVAQMIFGNDHAETQDNRNYLEQLRQKSVSGKF